MRFARRVALLAAAVLATLLVACDAGGPDLPNEPIVENRPWPSVESLRYVLVNGDQEQQGEGQFFIQPWAEARWLITQFFSDEDGNSDMTALLVDAVTLAPVAGTRTIVDADDDRRVEARTRYGTLDDGSYGVRIAQLAFEPADAAEPSSRRCNPKKVQEHAYDNDSSLYLWRTIRFEEGYTVTYSNVIANRREERALTLRVRRQERVRTPAGEFDAWLVGIEGEGRQTQSAWFATTPDHKLLVYNNGEDQILLYAGEGGPPPSIDEPGDIPADCR